MNWINNEYKFIIKNKDGEFQSIDDYYDFLLKNSQDSTLFPNHQEKEKIFNEIKLKILKHDLHGFINNFNKNETNLDEWVIEKLEKLKDQLKNKHCSFTGHRPDKIGGYNENNPITFKIKKELFKNIESLINKGVHTFICGGALGVDTWAAEIVLELKKKYFWISLWIASPFPSQPSQWPIHALNRYEHILNKANKVIQVSNDPYSSYKMQLRNEWMVDNSEILIAVWDGSKSGTMNCVKYAQSKHKEIIQLNPKEL